MSRAGGSEPVDAPRARGPVVGELRPPGSKSLTQRWLLLAALAEGTSTIENALRSDDVEALTGGLRTLGATVRWTGADSIEVRGVAGRFPGGGRLDAHEGGTPARFLMAAAAMSTRPSVLDGSSRLRKRPMSDGMQLLAALGAGARRSASEELPLEITPSAEFRRGGEIEIDAPASSQFLSAAALVAPWMERGLRVQVRGEAPSASYVELTVRCLRQLGAQASWDGRALQVGPGPLKSFTVRVEPDASSAAYGFALAAILPGSSVRVRGLAADSAQPDMAVVRALVALGARDASDGDGAAVAFGRALAGGELDASLWPDGSLAVMAAAATASAPVTIRGLGTLAAKESDRIDAMRAWLAAAGATVERGDDWMRLHGPLRDGEVVEVDPRRDHRVAMSAAVIGAVRGGVRVLDSRCVEKSWPGFWAAWADLLGR